MEIFSANISKAVEIDVQGKSLKTGIFKEPVDGPITLLNNGVEGSFVGNTAVHGGENKAVYAYSYDHYPWWKEKFPTLEWKVGMFGENLTLTGCNENVIFVGDVYEVGTATLQVCQPRHPCNVFGYRFGTQDALKTFIRFGKPGIYFKVLGEGQVQKGNEFTLVEKGDEHMSISLLFRMRYQKFNNSKLLERVLENPVIPLRMKDQIRAVQLTIDNG